MSTTFDDLFGSDDDQVPQSQPPQPQQTTPQIKSEIDELFPDSDDDVVVPSTTTTTTTTSKNKMGDSDDDSDDDDIYVKRPPSDESFLFGREAGAADNTPQAAAEDKSAKQDRGQSKWATIPEGEPEHFYIPQPTTTQPPTTKEFILLTIPKVVGTDPERYDPETFDYRRVLDNLPPFQREYTQGIESMIRWKVVIDPQTGEEKKVSNSRIVHWSNGDIHLQVGTQYFPLSVKGTKLEADKSTDYLFFSSSGLYFHVGNIVTSWKTSIEPVQLAEYGPKMQAVKSRLIEMDKDRRTQATMAVIDKK